MGLSAAVQIDGQFHRAELGVLAPGARFSRAFHTMGIAVDDLKVGQPQKVKCRPSRLAVWGVRHGSWRVPADGLNQIFQLVTSEDASRDVELRAGISEANYQPRRSRWLWDICQRGKVTRHRNGSACLGRSSQAARGGSYQSAVRRKEIQGAKELVANLEPIKIGDKPYDELGPDLAFLRLSSVKAAQLDMHSSAIDLLRHQRKAHARIEQLVLGYRPDRGFGGNGTKLCTAKTRSYFWKAW